MITIIDYGCGNIGSIENMLKKIGIQSKVVSRAEEFMDSTKLILPGVGHFDQGMDLLLRNGFDVAFFEKIKKLNIPVLGICLGMQLLCRSSEEGKLKGLGLIEADVVKFGSLTVDNLKVPHMGWNIVGPGKSNSLIPHSNVEQRFYFVHTYKVVTDSEDIVIGRSDYGGVFCAAIQKDNFYGVQFHPEKSHQFGIELFKRFVEL